MEETLTKGLNTLSALIFEVKLTLFFELLHSLIQLFVLMEVLVVVFGSVDAMYRTIMRLSELLQPFLREEIRDGLQDDSAVRRKAKFFPALLNHPWHLPSPIPQTQDNTKYNKSIYRS